MSKTALVGIPTTLAALVTVVVLAAGLVPPGPRLYHLHRHQHKR